MRDFVYNEEELAAGKTEINKLATDKKKQFVSFTLDKTSPFQSKTAGFFDISKKTKG